MDDLKEIRRNLAIADAVRQHMSRPVIAMASMLGLRGRLRSRESPELLKWQDYVDKDDPKGLEAWEIDEDIGQGVFATKKFGVGSFLLVYKGERISCKEAERREVEYEHMKHSYLYFYTHEKRNLCIDATKSDSLGRLVNDSPLGNCEMKLKIKDGQEYLCLFATKVVNKKDELRYNYGVNGLPWRKKENMVMPLILNKKKPLDIPISKVNSLEKASSSMITENDKKSGKICGYRLRNQLTSTESEEILDWRNYVDKLEDPLGMEVRIIDDEIGRGVFATRKFGVGSFLLSYKGDKLTILEAERREAEYEHMKHSYLFFYTHERRKMCIDATYANSLGKLVNDNPQGNCEMKLKIKANQEYLCLFATKVISENEELCYNYGVKGLPWRNKEEKKKKSVKVDKVKLKCIPTNYEEEKSSNVPSNLKSRCNTYERERSFNSLKSPVCSLSQDNLDEPALTSPVSQDNLNKPPSMKSFSGLTSSIYTVSQDNLDEPYSMKSSNALSSVYSVSHDSLDEPSSMKSSSDLTVSDCQDNLYEPLSLKLIPTDYEEGNSSNVNSNMRSIHTIYEREKSFNTLKSPVCSLSQDYLDESSSLKLIPTNYKEKSFFNVPSNIKLIPTSYERQKSFSALKLPACSLSQNNLDEPSSMKSFSALTSPVYSVSQDSLYEPSSLKFIPTNYEEEKSCNVYSNMKSIHTIYERERSFNALKSPVCFLSQDNLDEPSLVKLMPSNYVGKISSSALTSSIYAVSQDNLCEPSTLKSIPTNYEEEKSSNVPSNMKLINTIYERERPLTALKSPVCSLSQDNLCEPSTLKSIPTNYEEENSSNVPSNMQLINTIYERERPFNALKSPVCSLSQDNLCEPSTLKSIPTNYEEENSSNVPSNMKLINTIYERERPFNALKSPVCSLSQDNLDESSNMKSFSALTSPVYSVSQDSLYEPSSLKSIPTNYEEEKSCNVYSNMKSIHTIYERERSFNALKSPVCFLSQDNLDEPSLVKLMPSNYVGKISSSALTSSIYAVSQDNLCEPSTLKSIPTNYEEEKSSNVPSNMKLINTIYERERPLTALKSPVCSLSQDNLCEPSTLKSIPTNYEEENSSNVPSNMQLINTIYERERPFNALKSPVCSLSQDNLCEPSTLKSIPTNYEEENSSNVPSNMKLIHTIYERERPFNALKSPVCPLSQDNLDESSSMKSFSALTSSVCSLSQDNLDESSSMKSFSALTSSVYSVSQDNLVEPSALKPFSGLTSSVYSVSQDSLYEPSSLKSIPTNYAEENSSNVPSNMKLIHTIYERERPLTALKSPVCFLSQDNLCEPSTLKSIPTNYEEENSSNVPSNMKLIHTIYERERPFNALKSSVCSLSQDNLDEPSCRKSSSALTSVYSVSQDRLRELSSVKSSSDLTFSRYSVSQDNLYEPSSLKLIPSNYEEEKSSNVPSKMKSMDTIYEREKSFNALKLSCSSLSANNLNEPSSIKSSSALTSVYSVSQESLDEPSSMESSSDLTLSVYSVSQDDLNEPSRLKFIPSNYECKKPCSALTSSVYSVRQDNLDETSSKKSSSAVTLSVNSVNQGNLYESSSLKLKPTNYEKENSSNVPSNMKLNTIYEREKSFKRSLSQDNLYEPSSMKLMPTNYGSKKSSKTLKSSDNSASQDNLHEPSSLKLICTKYEEKNYSNVPSNIKVIHNIYERENSFNALKLPVCSISQDKFDEPSSMKSSRGQTSSVYSVSKDNLDKPPNMMKQIPTMSMDEMFYSDSMSGVYNVDQNDKDCPFTMKSITINNKGEKTSNVLTPSVNFVQDNLDEPSESISLTTSSSKGDNPSNAFMLSMYSVEKASSSIVSEECSSNVEVLTNTDIVKDVEVEEKHIECDSEKEEENESDKDYMPESGLSDSSEDEICEERKAIIYTPKLIKPKMLSKTSTRKMGEPKLSVSKTCTLMISEPGTSLTDTEAKLSSYKKPYRICMFCHKMKSKLSQHLKHFHKTEERVKRALQLPKKERDTEFDRMKKEGIKQQNLEEVRKDEPHFERERASDIRSDNLMMCNICDGFYSKRYIKRHSYICIKKSESSICSNGIHVSLLKHDNIVHSDDFVSEILSKFRLGIPSSKLCTTDPVLIQIGKKLWRKENKKKSKRAEVRKAVMSDMRRLASVYLEMLKCEKVLGELPCKDGNVSDIFKRNNFRHLEEAVEAYTTINFESSSDSEVKIKAGLKIGIYYLLKLVSKIMKGLYLVEANEEGDAHAADIDKFVAVLEMNHDMMFGDATYALNQSREERLRRPEAQPLESDIRKVREYTVKRIETIVAEYSLNKLNYTELRDLVICRLTLFNARRGGEPSRLHIKDWVDADEGAWLDKTLVKNLDSIDQILAKELKVSFQSGKGVKHLVPILFPKDTHVALRLLADENVRKQANIPKINKHLFPSTGGSYNHMSGWHALNNVCELLNLENRKNLTATKNRHFVSTKFSLMYVPEQDRDYIYKHLGHSEETNRHIYQNPLAIKALTVVGKRLLDMENKRDTLHSSLATNDREMETQENEESISMDNAGKDWHNSFVSRKPSEQNLVSNEMEELLMDDAGTEDSCLVLKKPKLEKSATEELEKLQMDDAEKIWHTSLTSKKTQLEYFSSREVEELPMVDVDTLAKLNERKSQSRSHPYKKVAARNYSRWTKEEEQILRQYFNEYYERKTEKKMPGRAEIRIFLQSQPIKHELKTVATNLMNEINKENRNATVVMKEIGIIN